MGTLATGPQRQLGQHADELDRVLRNGDIRAVFQPIVDLDTHLTVGFESLARGPAGSPLEQPDALFATAYRESRAVELDWACRQVALRTALDTGLPPGCWLSVNAEPETLGLEAPAPLRRLLDMAGSRVPLVLEITERDVCARPAELLHTIKLGTEPRLPHRPRRHRSRPARARAAAGRRARGPQARPPTRAATSGRRDRRHHGRGQTRRRSARAR